MWVQKPVCSRLTQTAALSTFLFNRGYSCGGCYEIRCVATEWCWPLQPSIVITATNLCPPNWAKDSNNGGWCNPPRCHFHMAKPAFRKIVNSSAGIVPTQYRRYLLCFWKTHELSKQFPFQILLNIQSHTFWASGHMQSSCKTWNNELCQMFFHNHPMRDQFYYSHSCEALRFCLQFLCFFWLVTAGFHAWSMDQFVSSFRATVAGTLCSSPM